VRLFFAGLLVGGVENEDGTRPNFNAELEAAGRRPRSEVTEFPQKETRVGTDNWRLA
jgi:hypothetical protein